MPDIDIDFPDRDQILEKIKYIPASIKDSDGEFKKHNTGVYLQDIPVNPLNGFSSIDYKEAEQRGYFKIDFLNAGVYKNIRDEQHLNNLMTQEPLWDLLEQDDFINLLFHVNGHGTLLRTMKPKTIPQLAAVLAMIRPGKRYLIGRDWTTVMNEIWKKPENGEYYFKKSHATAYAVAIVVQMNLICESISYEFS